MSYAGPDSRTRDGRAAARGADDALTTGRPGASGHASALRPLLSRDQLHESRGEAGEADWRQVALFGAGLLIGIAVGAGAALLAAPYSGAETRAAIASRVHRARRATTLRGRDAWEDLRDELRDARKQMRRRKARRALEREMELG